MQEHLHVSKVLKWSILFCSLHTEWHLSATRQRNSTLITTITKYFQKMKEKKKRKKEKGNLPEPT